ncbi:hypothetical protein [Roseibium sp.]|uniref:hypothetical protein n=1 Tax=Roseibium sp. TaxID=1936156 RepID=UPI003BB19F34
MSRKSHLAAKSMLHWLAVSIGNPCWKSKKGGIGEYCFYHQHEFARESAHALLEKIGVLDRSGYFLIAPEELSATLDKTPDELIDFDECLAVFVANTGEYGTHIFPTPYQRCFAVPIEYQQIGDALTQVGYLEPHDSGSAWTDAARPALERAQLWGVGTYEAIGEGSDNECQLFHELKSVPDEIQKQVAALIKADRNIAAIQLLRDNSNLGFKNSKTIVEKKLIQR